MGKRGQRTGPFHCLESGLWSYARGEHCRPSELELHVIQCPECQQKLLLIAGEAAQLVQDRPTRKLFRVYQLLEAAGLVPTVAELRVISDKKVRTRWRRNALVRLMMDIVALVDALDEKRQLPGEQGGIYTHRRNDVEAQFIEDGHVDTGACPELHALFGVEDDVVPAGRSPEEVVLEAARHAAAGSAQHQGGEDLATTQVEEESPAQGRDGDSTFVSQQALAENLGNASASVAEAGGQPLSAAASMDREGPPIEN